MNHEAGRAAIVVGTVIGALAAFGASGGAQEITPRPTPTAPVCARPNVMASVLRAVEPDTPALAAQQGIYGTVQVVVSLDADSHVVGTRIQSSPSAVLNQAAMNAVRQSTFRTEIRNCLARAADYIFSVDFTRTVTFSTTASGERIVSVLGVGSAVRAPDSAVVQTSLDTYEENAAIASAKNDAAFDALKAKLGALGITDRKIVSQSTVQPSRPGSATTGSGFTASRQIAITVDAVANAPRVAAAVATLSGIGGVAIRYLLKDHAAASREALTAALNDADGAAREAVTSQRLHLGARKEVVVPPEDRAPAPNRVVPFFLVPVAGGFKEPDMRIPDVTVRATATVTYTVTP
jgi:TonB family protein